MIKIYCGQISKLITETKFDTILNEITETNTKRINEKKAGEVLLLTALERENIFISKPLEYIYRGSKPYLKDYEYYYNLSHTKDLIVLAISNQEIGIDIEEQSRYIKNIKDISNIKDWTITEAAVKYLGTGIKDFKKIKIDADVLFIEDQLKLYQTFHYSEYFISIVYDNATEIQIITY